MNSEEIKSIATSLGIPVILLAALIFIIMNAQNILLIKGWICGWFAAVSSTAHKEFLSSKLSGSVAALSSQISNGKNDLIPSNLKIEWVTDEELKSFVKNKQVVVRIKQNRNPQDNLVMATSAYVMTGLLHNHRRYIDKSVISASHLAMIRKIIQKSGKTSITHFEENYLFPYLEKDGEISFLYEQLRMLDKNGMFVNILLREFLKAADGLFGEPVDPCLVAESKELVRFLCGIASRNTGDNTDLSLQTNYFKIAIILTANDKTLTKAGIEPYIVQIKKLINQGYDTVYFFGIGSKKSAADLIAKRLYFDETMILYPERYRYKHTFRDGHQKDAVLYEISTKI